jgi:hypothetical protein
MATLSSAYRDGRGENFKRHERMRRASFVRLEDCITIGGRNFPIETVDQMRIAADALEDAGEYSWAQTVRASADRQEKREGGAS